MKLRQYQQDTYNDIQNEWQRGQRNVLVVQPTGSGKTALFTKLMADTAGPSMATAHRRELVGQISLALAKWGVYHRIIAPNNVIRLCVARQRREIGRSYHNPQAPRAVVAIDTLLRRKDTHADFLRKVQLHVQDEAHHVLHDPINKWGRGYDLTPAARFLGVTATAVRADGNGLGRHSNGVFDSLIHGVHMRELINAGYLKKYRVFNARTRPLELTQNDVSTSTGDWKRNAVGRALQQSQIVGDVVQTYKTHAMGKRGITFAPNVEIAREIADNFNAAGVPAMCVWDKTSDEARESAVRRLEAGELLQLVNVDLFGEGFDLPAIETASFARPTLSYGLYVQQFGRPLRPTPGVDTAIIFDHVGNVLRHGLPDGNVRYTLDATERHRQVEGSRLARTCEHCSHFYERILRACPYCGGVPTVQERSAPEFVDGDLTELDAETLERMRGAADGAVQSMEDYEREMRAKHTPRVALGRHMRYHAGRVAAQERLRSAISVWAGFFRDKGASDSEIYRRFYHAFGVDILSAQALNPNEAADLEFKILKRLPC